MARFKIKSDETAMARRRRQDAVNIFTFLPTSSVSNLGTFRFGRQESSSSSIPAAKDDMMNVVETAGVKRQATGEPKDDRLAKAARGHDSVSNLPNTMSDPEILVPMIKLQMIMHGVDFDP